MNKYKSIKCFDGTTVEGFLINKPPKTAKYLKSCYDHEFNMFDVFFTGKRYYIKYSKV